MFFLFLTGSALVWLRVALQWSRIDAELRSARDLGPPINPFAILAAILLWTFAPIVVGEALEVAQQPALRRVQATALANAIVILGAVLALRVSGNRRLPAWPQSVREWRRDLVWGAGGFLASLLPVFSIVLLTRTLRSDETQHSFLQMISEAPTLETVLWVTLVAVVCAPLAEELLFRVIFQGGLVHGMPARSTILLVAVLFCAVHANTLQRIPDALALLPLALILGVLYHWKRSYVMVVVVHMLFNAANLGLSLLTAD